LQDYNLPVLSLVTLPNLVLAALRALPADVLAQATTTDVEVIQEVNDDDEDADEYADEAEDKFGDDDEEQGARERRTRGEVDGFDGRRAGTLDLTPELLAAFTKVLEERGVDLQFTYGDWSGMATTLADEAPYSLVLTAETIYAEESQRALLDVLQTSARYTAPLKETARAPASLEASLDSLSVRDDWARQPLVAETPEPVVLVAAKVLYFGVGGGLDSFLAQVAAEKQGWSARVRDWVKGVGRAVVRVGWQA
jgi:protein-histidine N-methyltransferase